MLRPERSRARAIASLACVVAVVLLVADIAKADRSDDSTELVLHIGMLGMLGALAVIVCSRPFTLGLQPAAGAAPAVVDDVGDLTSYAVHQMRAPLTVLRGHAELLKLERGVAVDESADVMVSEVERLAGLMEGLLVIVSAGRPDFLVRQPVDIGQLLADQLTRWEAVAPRC